MLRKNVKEITFSDLNALKEDEVREDKKLDYKCTLLRFLLIPSHEEGAKKAKKPHKIEFLKDVSAFANTSGGHLLYGIKSENGLPVEICGVNVANNEDTYIRQLDELLDSQLEPAIQAGSRAIGFIDFEPPKKEKVMALYVSKSWRAPHRVKLDGQFYKRSASLNRIMNVDDLRIAFTVSESIIRNTRRFKEERIERLRHNITPVRFLSAEEESHLQVPVQRGFTKFILHLIPLDWFASANYVDLKKGYDNREKIMPMNWRGNRSSGPERYNIDGILMYDEDEFGYTHSYTQLYRKGIIEAVEGGGSITRDVPGGSIRLIDIQKFEKHITDSLRDYLEMLQILEVDPPIFLFLTLLGVEGVKLLWEDKGGDDSQSDHAIDRNELNFPEVCIKSFTEEPRNILKDVFGALWNACGEATPEV